VTVTEYLTYAIIGCLSALTVISATSARLVLPRCEDGSISLGFLGRIIIGAATALVWQRDPAQAFLAGLVVVLLTSQFARVRRMVTEKTEESTSSDRIEVIRHKLSVARQNAAYYGAGEVPVHLVMFIEDAEKELRELSRGGD
jgi:small basic protein